MSDRIQTFQEFRTPLPPDEVLARARTFFSRRNSLYATFLDKEGPGFVTFRGQGTEEVVIAAQAVDGATLVTGSSYLFDMQVGRFLATLPPADGGSSTDVATQREVVA
jgi:hypothetical protein